MNLYFVEWLAKEKMREAEERAREARLRAILHDRVRAEGQRRLGVQHRKPGHDLATLTWLVEGVLRGP